MTQTWTDRTGGGDQPPPTTVRPAVDQAGGEAGCGDGGPRLDDLIVDDLIIEALSLEDLWEATLLDEDPDLGSVPDSLPPELAALLADDPTDHNHPEDDGPEARLDPDRPEPDRVAQGHLGADPEEPNHGEPNHGERDHPERDRPVGDRVGDVNPDSLRADDGREGGSSGLGCSRITLS